MGNTGSNYQPISNVVELTPQEQAMKLKYEKAQEAISNSKWGLFIHYCCKNDLFIVSYEMTSIFRDFLHFKRNYDIGYVSKIILGYYETITEAEIAIEKRLRDIYGKIENENLVKYPVHGYYY